MSKSRAANNMGTVRKRSDGRWEGRYTAPDGKQHSVYAKSEAECIKALKAAMRKVDMGEWLEPSKMTMAQWLDIWLKDYQSDTSEHTVVKYRCIVKKQFKPSLGQIKVSKLKPLHVRHMITTMQENKLAATTIQSYMRIFRTCMYRAIEAGLIDKNPAQEIKAPKGQPKKFCIIDRAQIPAFLAAAKETPYENELLIMLLAGLRAGEVRGLRWQDIDFDAGTVNIQRQLHPKSKKLVRFTLPKYGEVRLLYLSSEVMNALRNQKRKQAEQRLASGNWIDDEISTDLVFRLPNGDPQNDKVIYRAVKKVAKAIDMPDLTPHDLRHSYAIAALRSGANVQTVQHNLGHKTVKMTMEVYVAYTEDTGKTDADKLSVYLQNISN